MNFWKSRENITDFGKCSREIFNKIEKEEEMEKTITNAEEDQEGVICYT